MRYFLWFFFLPRILLILELCMSGQALRIFRRSSRAQTIKAFMGRLMWGFLPPTSSSTAVTRGCLPRAVTFVLAIRSGENKNTPENRWRTKARLVKPNNAALKSLKKPRRKKMITIYHRLIRKNKPRPQTADTPQKQRSNARTNDR